MADDFLIGPDPTDPRLTRAVEGTDHTGAAVTTRVVMERPLTIYLNAQEIVTAMTIGDYPEYLALGFLSNQGMLQGIDDVTGVDYDDDLQVVVVRTASQTRYEEKLKKKTRTSGCAVGTVFGDMMEGLEGVTLPDTPVKTSWLYALAHRINTAPSLYLEAGAIHGTVLCQGDRPLVYMEDVGRHNAVDKIAGWMLRRPAATPADKILYTTGRLTSEMVIKTAIMGIPVLATPLRVYRLGRGYRAGHRADPDRPDARQAVRLPGGRRPPDPRRRSRLPCPRKTASIVGKAPMPTDIPGPDPGGRPGAAHGRRRQVVAVAGWQADPGPCHRTAVAAGRHGSLLNANGDPARFAAYRSAGAARQSAGLSRPAGGRAGRSRLGRGAAAPSHIVTAAADTPFFPADLVTRLASSC